MANNPCNPERLAEDSDPYAIFENTETGWTWCVLKMWNTPEAASTDRYARVMCRVSSPFTHGGFDIGDCYLADLLPQWNECDLRAIGDEMTEWLERFNAALAREWNNRELAEI